MATSHGQLWGAWSVAGETEKWIFVLFYFLYTYISMTLCYLKIIATVFKEAWTSENVLSSKYMMTFIMCFEGKTWGAWTACIRGMGPDVWEYFPEEVTFDIFQFCPELSLSKGTSKISMFGIKCCYIVAFLWLCLLSSLSRNSPTIVLLTLAAEKHTNP